MRTAKAWFWLLVCWLTMVADGAGILDFSPEKFTALAFTALLVALSR